MEVNREIFSTLSENLRYLDEVIGEGLGLVKDQKTIWNGRMEVGIVYLESMADKEAVRRHVLSPLLKYNSPTVEDKNYVFAFKNILKNADDAILFCQSHLLTVANSSVVSDMTIVVDKLLLGHTVVFMQRAKTVLVIGTRDVAKKNVESPENETTIMASQESFTDDLCTNMSLIIKRMPAAGLKMQEFVVGSCSRTHVKLVWFQGITDPSMIEKVKGRIEKIHYDNITGLGMLIQLIIEHPVSILPQYRQTERPDVAAKDIAEGKFVIICEGSPFAIIAPFTFWENFQNMDDFEDKPLSGSYMRFVRYISFVLATIVSSIYIACVSYNQVVIPPDLALSIASGRERMPFPSIVEMLLLTLAISVIREAGIRMPKSVGYFVGALAAVVIGQATVMAGYVSPSLIIVIAVATISGFALSNTTLYYPSVLINYFFILLAGFFGMFGVFNGIIIMIWYTSSMTSFDVPYLYPLIPFDKAGFKGAFGRMSYKSLSKRMKIFAPIHRDKMRKK